MLNPECSDIPIGRQNAISKAALCQLWGCSEREARNRVAQLRAEPAHDGYVILSTSNGPTGYWRSDDPQEIAAFIRETEHRAKNTFLSLKAARQVLEEKTRSGQMRFEIDV